MEVSVVEQYLYELVERIVDQKLNPTATEEYRMVAQHGEQVNYMQAAKLLNRDTRTIRRWAQAGYIEDNGHGISVRSIARFINQKRERIDPISIKLERQDDFIRLVP